MIIDSSARLESRNGVLRPEGWLRRMQRCGIDHAVIAPSDEFVVVYNEEGNRQMARIIKQHRDRFSGLAVVNPWYGKRAVTILRKAFAQPVFCGLYLNPGRQGFHLTESLLHPLIRVCERYGKPVFSHTGTPIAAEPFQLAELARQFPGVQFVMGHTAWTDFWYDVLPAARQAPNILIDVSCTMGATVRELIAELGVERVLFGSGYPKSLPERELDKLRRLNLAPEVFDRLIGRNAQQLWKVRP